MEQLNRARTKLARVDLEVSTNISKGASRERVHELIAGIDRLLADSIRIHSSTECQLNQALKAMGHMNVQVMEARRREAEHQKVVQEFKETAERHAELIRECYELLEKAPAPPVIAVGVPVKTSAGFGVVEELHRECAGSSDWWVRHADGIRRWFSEHNIQVLVPVQGGGV